MDTPENASLDFLLESKSYGENSYNGKLQEIDIKEIKFLEAIGKGSFGVVHKAIWLDNIVAVKKVETDTEVSAFQNEIKQLSRIQHENIIHVYGVAIALPSKCLVMEFADGGSLYEFLHCEPRHKYNISQALSWLLQCAKAIHYLHSYQPKPIIHRDLKPLNMLLTNERRVLKVCDFGTACVLRSTMTDNKGSIAWMAPEVMKCQSYDQKCDVYSWGMILWEVLTRRIPFVEWGLPVRIIWQVTTNNKRPPPIQGCPRPLENLITSCWSDPHSSRPSMQQVLEVITPLYRVIGGVQDLSGCSSSSSGDSYTEFFPSAGNNESSGGRTSQGVSELPSTSNTMDFASSRNSDSPHEGLEESLESTSEPPRPNKSKLPVMNSSYTKFRREETNFPTPFNFVDVNLRRNYRSRNPSKMGGSGGSSTGDSENPESVSPFTPLSITIPNTEPAERDDVVIASSCGLSHLVPGHTSGSVPKSPSQYGTRHVDVASSACRDLPSSIINIEAATPNTSRDRLDLSPRDPVGTFLSHFGPEDVGNPSPPVRRNLESHPLANLRRRSAEVPQNVSCPNASGHKRSSSYGSSKLIGFEPLVNSFWREEEDGASVPPRTSFEPPVPPSPPPIAQEDDFVLLDLPRRGDCPTIGNTSTNYAANAATTSTTASPNYSKNTFRQPIGSVVGSPGETKEGLGDVWQLLDDDLKPVMPLPNHPLSQQIFQDHEELAHKLLVAQENIVFLDQKKHDLLTQVTKQEKNHKACQQRYNEKILQLLNKNKSLQRDQLRLDQQLTEIKRKRINPQQPQPQHYYPPQHQPQTPQQPRLYHPQHPHHVHMHHPPLYLNPNLPNQ